MSSERPETRPEPWNEVVGRLDDLQVREGVVEVRIASEHTLTFPSESPEAQVLLDEIRGKEGRQISILRTDLASQPLVVQEVDHAS